MGDRAHRGPFGTLEVADEPIPEESVKGCLAVLLAAVAVPGVTAAPPLRNVALGASYQLSPPPTYPGSTDPGDAVQLTDGKTAGGRFWTDKGAVGWVGEKVVSVTLDLGSVCDIGGASLRTAAGTADVEWPASILLFGSVDAHGWTLLGDLVSLDAAAGGGPPSRGFAAHRYESQALTGQARFVRVMVGASGPYVFADEIEVFGAPAVARRAAAAPVADTGAEFWRIRAAARLRAEVRRQIAEARRRVAGARLDAPARAKLLRDVDALETRVAQVSLEGWSAASTQLPVNEVHAAALAIAGRVEQLGGAPALGVWPASPWDPLDMTSPEPAAAAAAIEVGLMNGERRSAAIDVRNSTGRAAIVTVDLSDLDRLAPGWVEARPVAWTGDAEARPVALALLEPGRRPGVAVLEVPPGVTRQVFVTFSPTSLAGGLHDRAVRVSSPGLAPRQLRAKVRILPGRFPASPRLHVGGWDYLNDRAGAAGASSARTASLLRSFGVDLPWATSSAMPFGDHGPGGDMTRAPSTAGFDTWTALWPRAARYRVYVGARDAISGLRRGTPPFRAAVRAWATFWAAHLRSRGLRPQDVELLFVDEPRGAGDDAERQADWARALNDAGTGLRVWIDPLYPDPADTPRAVIGTASTICLNRQLVEASAELHRAFALEVRKAGKEVELYGTNGPAARLDPYTYYRLMAWRAFDVGATGIGFWSFTDTGGGNSWREYAAPRTHYAPLFLDTGAALPGKHLFAIREGVQDYEILALLRDAIARRSATRGTSDVEVVRATSVLESAVARVLGASRPDSYRWGAIADRSAADAARLEVAGELERLAGLALLSPAVE